jgi:hypothetical protein
MCDRLDEGFARPGDQFRFAVKFDICATRMSTTSRRVQLFRLPVDLDRGSLHTNRLLQLTVRLLAGVQRERAKPVKVAFPAPASH